jgi:hypothetical protein
VELFSWYTAKILPGKARKYLGRGSQVTSGAYDTLRTDKITTIPNYQVPIKYRVRFVTTLEGRGEPVEGDGSYGGEAVGNEFRFERGSVFITNVTMEKGVNPTYWRMAPAEDKYTGFTLETWDPARPQATGIQNIHIANGAISSDKLKRFSIFDDHINNNAKIQESKLLLNFPTHGHTNKALIDSITGFGSSGTSTNIAREDHDHTSFDDLTITGTLKEVGKYEIVHRRPLYGLAGDMQFQTDSTTWEDMTTAYGLFDRGRYGLPEAKTGAKRYYRLYAVYSDNITSSDADVRTRIRILSNDGSTTFYEWKMPYSWGTSSGRGDLFSSYFQTDDTSVNQKIQVRIQNDAGTYAGTDKEVGIIWLELIAYDVYES